MAHARPEKLGEWSARLTARDGRSFELRLLKPDDLEMLSEYFLSLSDCTKMLYGPHPFDRATAEKLCKEEDPTVLRLVTVERRGGIERIGSYFILFLTLRPGDASRYPDLPPEGVCSLAPSVRDELQNTGVGSLVMAELVEIARSLGMRRMILCGGVQARNLRGYHFYEKWGFTKVREFPTQIMNYDMIRQI